jgi:hypothetical protein
MEEMGPYEVEARAPPDGGKGASAMMFAGRPPNDATKSRPLFLRSCLFVSGFGVHSTDFVWRY